MEAPTDALKIQANSDSSLPEPFRSRMGDGEWRNLSDFYGLSHFGVNLESLHPGAQSSLRHWHSKSDEFVFVLQGPLVLISEMSETILESNMCIGFKAGEKNGHHIVNRSRGVGTFIVIGSRVRSDEVTYPDDDIKWGVDENGNSLAVHKDGKLY